MTKTPCDHYTPWIDHGLSITQCFEYFQGQCGESLSPHYQQDCPWENGYPCQPATGEGTWKAPILKGNGLAQLLRLDDEANPDLEKAMIKPHCEHFNPNPVDDRICAWWDFGFGVGGTEADTEGFCSRPDWEERICETQGQRNVPEDALSGPVGINVARLLGIGLPPINYEPEAQLVENVARMDTETED